MRNCRLQPLLRKAVRDQKPCVIVFRPKGKPGKMKIKTRYLCYFSPTNPDLMLYASTTPDITPFNVVMEEYSSIFLTLPYNIAQRLIQNTNQALKLN
jgi:hypothetical protein